MRKVGVERRRAIDLAASKSATHVLFTALAGTYSKRKLLLYVPLIYTTYPYVAWRGT